MPKAQCEDELPLNEKGVFPYFTIANIDINNPFILVIVVLVMVIFLTLLNIVYTISEVLITRSLSELINFTV